MVLGRGWLYTEPSDLILNIIQQEKGLKIQHKEEPYLTYYFKTLTMYYVLFNLTIEHVINQNVL